MELVHAFIRNIQHVFLAAKMQAARGTRFNAGRLQAGANTVRTQCALIDLLGFLVKSGDIERTASHAVLAAYAIGLIEINNAIGVLDDCAIRRAGDEASWLFAVHALVFAHEPLHAIVIFNFIEFDQVPEVPCCFRHGLVSIVKNSG